MTPEQLAQQRLDLSYEYDKLTDELIEVTKMKSIVMDELSAKGASEATIKRKWEATPKGIEETIILLKMRSMARRMSGIKLAVDVANTKARNLY